MTWQSLTLTVSYRNRCLVSAGNWLDSVKAGLEKAQQLSGFAHSVPQTPELCCNPVTCHEAADVAEAMGREA